MNKYISPSQDELIHDAKIFKTIKFGATQPSPDDDRDYVAGLVLRAETRVFPEEYESKNVEILNQGSISSCVAHSCCSALAKGEILKLDTYNSYSPGYIYGNRAAGDFQDEGMIVREALKSLQKRGAVLYSDFPYNSTYETVKALIAEQREELAKKASQHTIINYFRCYSENDIKQAILDKGSVIVCVPVYTDFGRDLHKTETNHLVGYHAMIIVGWRSDNKWIVQNSWGYFWGYAGKLLMDFDYPICECWGITIRTNTDPQQVENDKSESKLLKLIRQFLNFIKKLFSR